MKVPRILQEQIIDFFKSIPNIHDTDVRRALVYHAALDSKLQDQIDFGKSSAHFFPLLVSLLLDYGTLYDGRYAIEVMLEATKSYIGQNKIVYCDQLIEELHRYVSNSEKNTKRDLTISTTPQKLISRYSKLLIILSLLIMLFVAAVIGIVSPLWEKNIVLSAEKESIRLYKPD